MPHILPSLPPPLFLNPLLQIPSVVHLAIPSTRGSPREGLSTSTPSFPYPNLYILTAIVFSFRPRKENPKSRENRLDFLMLVESCFNPKRHAPHSHPHPHPHTISDNPPRHPSTSLHPSIASYHIVSYRIPSPDTMGREGLWRKCLGGPSSVERTLERRRGRLSEAAFDRRVENVGGWMVRFRFAS
ncbi:hypothetical protein BJ875DRAFT_451834 [Amylocarpus encephaloides]|uniref:Uncharacterized protein n=1 Tax=Amylocarpus encephaloides TaxID=45428 RepID=A0A9P7YR15_9HELO|nr:hypothetical protein BJ875DRAFT_451834 [Amylocarpus encephaloides]